MVALKRYLSIVFFLSLAFASLCGADTAETLINTSGPAFRQSEINLVLTLSTEDKKKCLLGLMNKYLTEMVVAYKQNENNDEFNISVQRLYVLFDKVMISINFESSTLQSLNFTDICYFVFKYGSVAQELQSMTDNQRKKYIQKFVDCCKDICLRDLDSFLYSFEINLQDHFTPKIETN